MTPDDDKSIMKLFLKGQIMKIQYQQFNFRPKTIDTIAKANEIIAEYKSDGLDITLRQLYYQFVARDLISNTQREYQKLGIALNNGRLNGDVDWHSIVDRTRHVRANSHWTSPEDIIAACRDSYRIDLRENQSTYQEVWIEKDALINLVERACESRDVPHFSCRGYVSQSAMWRAGVRIKRQYENRDKVVILHLGDHDPSGIDMTRDIEDRLRMFIGHGVCRKLVVKRIALTRGQIDRYEPPPNPAKTTDSRYDAYIAEHGDESWELDALDPRVIVDLIRDEIDVETEPHKFDARKALQERERELLTTLADRMNDVADYLNE